MAKNVYSVTQVNRYIKNMFTQDFMLARIYVKGEVSNCKYHTSGHIYFSLKDESGAIACVMFAGDRVKGLHSVSYTHLRKMAPLQLWKHPPISQILFCWTWDCRTWKA